MILHKSIKIREIIILSSILLVTSLVYVNHFDNPFIFDDMHTIVENESIRQLDDWTTFFTDASTFSSLPANRAYRPIVTLMNAIDYAIAGGLDPTYFHYHIFFWFLVLVVLVFILIKHVYKISWNENIGWRFIALFATAWFALHTANAETINYICARSDSFSTLCIVASLLLYIHPIGKKWHLYLLTMVIGIWTKQTGVMFFPILFVYILLFEEHSLLTDFKNDTRSKVFSITKKVLPAGILASLLFIINQNYLTPESTHSTNFNVSRFEYITTQFYVIRHYLSNFILPINLSADPDIAIIKPWYHLKILSGLFIIIGMIYIMIKTSLNKVTRPVAFGIAWFFIALLPTTLNPLFQIANDHRMFFPFIGLFISIPWGVAILIKKNKLNEKYKNFRITLICIIFLTLFGHSYGSYQRNKVWDSSESIWLDVVIKSPKNARGLMNYGLTKMSEGNLEEALNYFEKALKLKPNYYALHINLGVAYGALKEHEKAVRYFTSAMALGTASASPEYFYAEYLFKNKKYNLAKTYLEKALQKSPNYTKANNLLYKINKIIQDQLIKIRETETKLGDKSKSDDYLEVSFSYYKLGMFNEVIRVCQKLLQVDPNNAFAYNNICSAYNQLEKWELGVKACNKALEIQPDYELAKNNLKWALDNITNQ